MKKTRFLNVLFCSILVFVLSSCRSNPVPELQNIAVNANAPQLSQVLYDQCLREAGRYPASAPAAYNATATYAFAANMHNSVERVRIFASKVRAYTPVEVNADVICIYESSETGLKYLTNIRTGHEGRVRIEAINHAVLTAYAKMAGKSVTKVTLFGVYAD